MEIVEVNSKKDSSSDNRYKTETETETQTQTSTYGVVARQIFWPYDVWARLWADLGQRWGFSGHSMCGLQPSLEVLLLRRGVYQQRPFQFSQFSQFSPFLLFSPIPAAKNRQAFQPALQ